MLCQGHSQNILGTDAIFEVQLKGYLVPPTKSDSALSLLLNRACLAFWTSRKFDFSWGRLSKMWISLSSSSPFRRTQLPWGLKKKSVFLNPLLFLSYCWVERMAAKCLRLKFKMPALKIQFFLRWYEFIIPKVGFWLSVRKLRKGKWGIFVFRCSACYIHIGGWHPLKIISFAKYYKVEKWPFLFLQNGQDNNDDDVMILVA